MLLDGVAFGRFELVHFRPQFQDGVDRAFHRPCHVAGHIRHRHEVLVIDALLFDDLRDTHQFAERHQAARAAHDIQILNAVHIGAAGAV